MRKSRLMICIAMLIMLVSAVSVHAQDATEEPVNVTIGVKAVLEDGNTWPGTFEDGATAHLYAFTGSEGDSVTISMTQDEQGGLDPFIVLLGPNGEVIAYDDDSGEDVSLSSLISDATLPADGTYFILATSYVYITTLPVTVGDQTDDQEEGESYELTLAGATTPTGETSVSITPITVGETLEGENSAETPVGYFTFEGKAGDTVNIFVSSDEFDTIVHIFGPDGSRIAVNDDDAEEGTLNSAVRSLELPEDGVYLIFATNLYFYNAVLNAEDSSFTGGEFTVTLE